jgi:hypothetical protein
MEDGYTSDFGWQWSMPAGFSPLQSTKRQTSYGEADSLLFLHNEHKEVHLSWAVLNGPPVDYVTDARFKSLIADRDPVNIKRLYDILLGILPPAGEIIEGKSLKLADQTGAVEMIQKRTINVEEPIHLYILLFPLEPTTTDRGPHFDGYSVRQVADPITNQILVLSPVCISERLNPDTNEVQQIFQSGHDRYQRIIFSAPEKKFSRLMPSVRRSARGFHYKVRAKSPIANRIDAIHNQHEQMNLSFQPLSNPPEGLRDKDLKLHSAPPAIGR